MGDYDTTLSSLVRINSDLVEKASITCARAFEGDSLTRWMVPDASKRLNLRYAFETMLRVAVLGGSEAYATSAECEGVAIWMPAGTKQSMGMLMQAGYPQLPLRCGWRYLLRDSRTMSLCEKLRKKYAPAKHYYLNTLAVDPGAQGRGFATALLEPMLGRLDSEETACYVETQNLKNVEMYRHFGFRLVYETRVPGTEHPLYLMLKEKPRTG
jgi:ribosomal protein S18 acetylase RimI-like enzyme